MRSFALLTADSVRSAAYFVLSPIVACGEAVRQLWRAREFKKRADFNNSDAISTKNYYAFGARVWPQAYLTLFVALPLTLLFLIGGPLSPAFQFTIGGITAFVGPAGWAIGVALLLLMNMAIRLVGGLAGLVWLNRGHIADRGDPRLKKGDNDYVQQVRTAIQNNYKFIRFVLFGTYNFKKEGGIHFQPKSLPSWTGFKKYIVKPLVAWAFCFAATFALFGSSFLSVTDSTFMTGILVSEVFRFALAAFAVCFIVHYIFRTVNLTVVESAPGKAMVAATEALKIMDLLDRMEERILARDEGKREHTDAEKEEIKTLKEALRKHAKDVARILRVKERGDKKYVVWKKALLGYGENLDRRGIETIQEHYKALVNYIGIGDKGKESRLEFPNPSAVSERKAREHKQGDAALPVANNLLGSKVNRTYIRQIFAGIAQSEIDPTFNPRFSNKSKNANRVDTVGYSLLSATLLILCVYTLFEIFTGGIAITTSKLWPMLIASGLGFASWVSARFTLSHTSGGPYGFWAAVIGMLSLVLITLGGLMWTAGLLTNMTLIAPGLMLAILFVLPAYSAYEYAKKTPKDKQYLREGVSDATIAAQRSDDDQKKLKALQGSHKYYKFAEWSLVAFKVILIAGFLLLAFTTMAMLFNFSNIGILSNLMDYATSFIIEKAGIGGLENGTIWLSVFSVFTFATSLFAAFGLLQNLLQTYPKNAAEVAGIKSNSLKSKAAKALKVIFTMGLLLVLMLLPVISGDFMPGFDMAMLKVFAVVAVLMPLFSGNANLFGGAKQKQRGEDRLVRWERMFNNLFGTKVIEGKAWQMVGREILVLAVLFFGSMGLGISIVGQTAFFQTLGGATVFLFTGLGLGLILVGALLWPRFKEIFPSIEKIFQKTLPSIENPFIKNTLFVATLAGFIAVLFAILVNSNFVDVFNIVGNPAAFVLMAGILVTMGFRWRSIVSDLMDPTLKAKYLLERPVEARGEIVIPNFYVVKNLDIAPDLNKKGMLKVKQSLYFRSYVYIDAEEPKERKVEEVKLEKGLYYVNADGTFKPYSPDKVGNGILAKLQQVTGKDMSLAHVPEPEPRAELRPGGLPERKSAAGPEKSAYLTPEQLVMVVGQDRVNVPDHISARFLQRVASLNKGAIAIVAPDNIADNKLEIKKAEEEPQKLLKGEIENLFTNPSTQVTQIIAGSFKAPSKVYRYELQKYVENLKNTSGLSKKDIALAEAFHVWQKGKVPPVLRTVKIGDLIVEQRDEQICPPLTEAQKVVFLNIRDYPEDGGFWPKWFKKLPPFAKAELLKIIPPIPPKKQKTDAEKEAVKEAKIITEEKVVTEEERAKQERDLWANFEKPIPTTLRHILGVANTWRHTLKITNTKTGEVSETTSTRMAVPSSISMPLSPKGWLLVAWWYKRWQKVVAANALFMALFTGLWYAFNGALNNNIFFLLAPSVLSCLYRLYGAFYNATHNHLYKGPEVNREQEESANMNLRQMLDHEVARKIVLADRSQVTPHKAYREYWGLPEKIELKNAEDQPMGQVKVLCPIFLAGLVTNADQASWGYWFFDHFVGEDCNEIMFDHKEKAVDACRFHDASKSYADIGKNPNADYVILNINAAINKYRNKNFDFSTLEEHQKFVQFLKNHIEIVKKHSKFLREPIADQREAEKVRGALTSLEQLLSQIEACAQPSAEIDGRNRALHYISSCDRAIRILVALGIVNCKSSKDRTGEEILYTDAMQVFKDYTGREYMYNASDVDDALFIDILCHLLMSGQQLETASANATGAYGIKIKTLLDPRIKARLIELDAYDAINDVAEFNKPGASLWYKFGGAIRSSALALVPVIWVICWPLFSFAFKGLSLYTYGGQMAAVLAVFPALLIPAIIVGVLWFKDYRQSKAYSPFKGVGIALAVVTSLWCIFLFMFSFAFQSISFSTYGGQMAAAWAVLPVSLIFAIVTYLTWSPEYSFDKVLDGEFGKYDIKTGLSDAGPENKKKGAVNKAGLDPGPGPGPNMAVAEKKYRDAKDELKKPLLEDSREEKSEEFGATSGAQTSSVPAGNGRGLNSSAMLGTLSRLAQNLGKGVEQPAPGKPSRPPQAQDVKVNDAGNVVLPGLSAFDASDVQPMEEKARMRTSVGTVASRRSNPGHFSRDEKTPLLATPSAALPVDSSAADTIPAQDQHV